MLLDQAIHDLAVSATLPATDLRQALPDRLATVGSVLLTEPVRSRDGWLAARARRTDRDRRRLAARVGALGQRLRDRPEADPRPGEVRRLLTDLEHYRQRLHDLAFDTVGLELGGSE